MRTFYQWMEAVQPQPPCESCKSTPKIKGERFCKGCKKAKIEDMKNAGYLRRAPQQGGGYRTADQKELTRDTKFGGNHSDH